MQPYLFPYIGYYQLLNCVETYIVYDDVNYIKSGWINRNYMLANGQKALFTLSLKKASPNKLINEIEIGNNHKKLLKTIAQTYSKSPFYSDIFPLIEKLFTSNEKKLSFFLLKSLEIVIDYLNIKTNILLSSSLKKNTDLKGQDKVIDICQCLGADSYINAIGGMKLYSKEKFLKEGIDLSFLKTFDIYYQQYKNEFIKNLSMIDVLMFNSPEDIKKYLHMFELVS
jgi:hypothetical protein